MIKLEVAALTHQGAVRPDNQDVIVVAGSLLEGVMAAPEVQILTVPPSRSVIVADGMGGHAAGLVASRFAATRLSDILATAEPDGEFLVDTIRRVNAGAYEAMVADPGLLGMGTTVVGLWMGERHSYVFNVGDSRCYRIRNGSLSQLSMDDTPERAADQPRRTGIITQAIGGGLEPRNIHPHIHRIDADPGSKYLLCSDGLTDMVGDSDIAEAVGDSPADTCRKLFDLAMQGGGRDNVSAVLVRPV